MKLPQISGKKVIRKLQRGGYVPIRQSGSHVTLLKGNKHITVPLHKTLKKGTLHSIIKDSGFSPLKFKKL